MNGIRWRAGRWLAGLLAALWLCVPQTASAHASLIEADPASGSVLEEAPDAIRLTFNERLESGLYFIRVYDGMGREVTKEQAALSQDRRELGVALPRLGKGTYTVSYRVISADGHPVSASYVFHVGEASTAHRGADGGHHHHHHAEGVDGQALLLHGVKAVYLAAMLLFAGLALWPLRDGRYRLAAWQLNVLRVFLLALIGWIGLQLSQLMDGWTADHWAALWQTSLGRLWAVHLVLAIVGLALSGTGGRSAADEPAWKHAALAGAALLLLIVKATSGHAAATETAWASIALDAVHLLMAALWAGGLLLLLVLWRRDRERLQAFLRAFARFAWISIAVLAASGLALTVMMLPGIPYLLYSGWGIALLVKVGAVLLVVTVAGVIRWQMKRRAFPDGRLVAADFGLALAIIAIAGVLTGLNPVPVNKPLHWHVMGYDIHMTAQITPNEPGPNRFWVKVWLPEEDGEPERVQLQLVPLIGGEEPAPIDIPLAPSEDLGEMDVFLGFNRYDYTAEGIYLAFPGKWQVRVLVTAPGGKSYAFDKEMRVY